MDEAIRMGRDLVATRPVFLEEDWMTRTVTAAEFVKMTKGKRATVRVRPVAGKMNKLETAYAKELDRLKATGEVVWWGFEFYMIGLAKNTHMRPDFCVYYADTRIEFHDTKRNPSKSKRGTVYSGVDPAWNAKAKIAVELGPIPIFKVRLDKALGWVKEEVGQ